MKKIILALTVMISLTVFNYGIAQEPNLDFEPGKLIIKSTQSLSLQFFGNSGAPLIDSLNNYYGVSLIEQLFASTGVDPQRLALYNQMGLGRIYILTLPDSTDILQAMEAYKSIAEVEYAEPNWYVTPLDVYPCDELFQLGHQWGLFNWGEGICRERADIKAPEAWQIEKGDTNLVVAIIDSGIRRNYDSFGEIKNRVWVNWAERNGQPGVDDDGNGYTDDSIGWNFVTNTPFVEPDNDRLHQHGTHMASIIGQETDSTNNDCWDAAGINWSCKLMNLKVDLCVWRGGICYVRLSAIAIIEAIWYAINNEAKVLNLSFGRFFKKLALPDPWPTMQEALRSAYNYGVISVASMGIRVASPDSSHFPAAFKQVLAVGATRCNDNRVTLDFETWESNYGDYIDLIAPGSYIVTSFGSTSGTSPATAFVSGIASLVITHRKKLIPSWSLTDSVAVESIYEVLRHTADDTVGNTYVGGDPNNPEDTVCWDKYYGWGRANVFRALVAVSHGDADNSSQINVADVTYLLAYLFQGGPPPVPVEEMGDANCDGGATLSDIVYLITYLFRGGAPPPLCYTDCSEP